MTDAVSWIKLGYPSRQQATHAMQQALVNRSVIILVLGVISVLFYHVVKPFLLSIFLAALFSALFTPLYRWFLARVGNRPALASMLTLLLVLFFVFVPLFMVFGAVLAQALDIAQSAKPWVQQQLAEPGLITAKLEALPFYEQTLPYKEMGLDWLGKITGSVSKWTVDAIQALTLGTFSALLSIVIILYTMFFFLMDGDRLLYYLLYYLPLNDHDERKLLKRFTSVTRATLKGTAVIGILQGTLAGIALYIAGIPSALFWAVAMMFLSVVPGIGTALVWLPAVIYLIVNEAFVPATLLAVYCVVVVGSIDNVLRPKLVGNDTRLHELMIFFSTLGGLAMFGFMGFVIGPIIAALFVTMWELYGSEFSEWLPTTAFKPRSGEIVLPHQRMNELADIDAAAGAATATATGATRAAGNLSSNAPVSADDTAGGLQADMSENQAQSVADSDNELDGVGISQANTPNTQAGTNQPTSKATQGGKINRNKA